MSWGGNVQELPTLRDIFGCDGEPRKQGDDGADGTGSQLGHLISSTQYGKGLSQRIGEEEVELEETPHEEIGLGGMGESH